MYFWQDIDGIVQNEYRVNSVQNNQTTHETLVLQAISGFLQVFSGSGSSAIVFNLEMLPQENEKLPRNKWTCQQ